LAEGAAGIAPSWCRPSSRRARPSTIVSHHLELDEAPDARRRFDERRDGYLKVILRPA
jgi:threonine dehydrogenase-like Zn-dependent dehydrogenase